MTKIFKNLLVDGQLVDIKIKDGKIIFVGKTEEDGTDVGGLKCFPGLFDVHTHGCIGCDTMDGNNLLKMADYLAKNGTTSFLPTTMTMSIDDIKRVVNIKIPKTNGAKIYGFHAEGPYVAKKYKGAQNEKFIKNPTIEEFNQLDNVAMVTVAPELDGAMEFIKECKCVVAMGHTDATYDCATEAIKNGANCITHTFNAMAPLNHREPGPVGAAMDNNIYVQVISDGLHLHKSVVRMLYRLFGVERMVLISDSMCATGLSDGEYSFGGQPITVKNGVARTHEGAIAGSTSTLLTCVKKAIEFGIPEADAFKMASYTPAKMLGLKKGELKEGYDGEFIAVDGDYNIKMCVIDGNIIEL